MTLIPNVLRIVTISHIRMVFEENERMMTIYNDEIKMNNELRSRVTTAQNLNHYYFLHHHSISY